MKKTISALFLVVFTLAGCSGSPVEKTDEYIAEANYEDALEWINEEIEDEPENPLFHTLAAEITLRACAHSNCFDQNPEVLAPLTQHFNQITSAEYMMDDEPVNLHERLINLTHELIASKHHPKALATINHYMPYGLLMQAFTNLTFKQATTHILKGDIPPASSLLQSIADKVVIKDPNGAFAMLMNGYITNDNDMINKAVANFPKADADLPLNDDAIQALPYAIFQQFIEKHPNNGTTMFITEFRNILKIANIPYFLTERGQAKIANAVYAMSRNKEFLERAKLYTSADKKDKNQTQQALELKLIKLALLTNPKNEKSWDVFIEPATTYAEKTGDASIFYQGLTPADIPSNIITEYNAALFKVAEQLTAKNTSILDIIQHIILPADKADAVKAKVTTLLNEAMITAVNNANYDLVYAYASFQPDIARLSRQKVVSITIEALENKWRRNEFEGMDTLAKFLSETMGIDFSLDSLLLQSFADFLAQNGVQKQLNASTVDDLLLDHKDVKVNLGEKFAFLQKHFAKQPDVIDNLLKSLIVKAEGFYGIPTALHKLYSYFSEKFPESDRYAYLINAVKHSLTQDTELNALQFAQAGEKVQAKYPEIPASFIVNETMKRINSLEDSKKLWAECSPEFKELLRHSKPQFTTLMDAIDAYENGDYEHAARLFTILSDTKLIEQARPYLQEYVETVREQVGVYAIDTSVQKPEYTHTQMLYIDLIKDEQATAAQEVSTTTQEQTDLLAVKVTLISRLGAVQVQSPQNLTEDYGKVFRYEIVGRINPNTMEITIPDNQKTGTSLPLPFEKIFGSLVSLTLEGDRIIYVAENELVTFKRVSTYSTTKPNFIDGKYSITHSDVKNDKRSNHIMPVGSMLEFKVNKHRMITPQEETENAHILYPVQGLVYHPSSLKPRPIEGLYEPDKQVVAFSYNYPLITGGTLDAIIRCQVISSKIICAGHNKHWGRQRFSHIVSGKKVFTKEAPSVKQQSKINRPQ